QFFAFVAEDVGKRRRSGSRIERTDANDQQTCAFRRIGAGLDVRVWDGEGFFHGRANLGFRHPEAHVTKAGHFVFREVLSLRSQTEAKQKASNERNSPPGASTAAHVYQPLKTSGADWRPLPLVLLFGQCFCLCARFISPGIFAEAFLVVPASAPP